MHCLDVLIESSVAHYFNQFSYFRPHIAALLHLFFSYFILHFKIFTMIFYMKRSKSDYEPLPVSSVPLWSSLALSFSLCVSVSFCPWYHLLHATLSSPCKRTESHICPGVGYWKNLAYSIRACPRDQLRISRGAQGGGVALQAQVLPGSKCWRRKPALSFSELLS